MRKDWIGGIILVIATSASALPSWADAPGFVVANVNLRAGPGTQFPPVALVPAGSPVTMYGCTAGYAWCDVSWGPSRGWMAQRYLRLAYQNTQAPVPGFAAVVGLPIVTFEIGPYWNAYYAGQPWFGNLWQYGGGPGPGGGPAGPGGWGGGGPGGWGGGGGGPGGPGGWGGGP
ncbi:SH3 domain-containing protein [Segnochrobactrum spirostomi]|uniref:SH3 domain-containing protein n=1 Tax=Segnochrobactrum spirostomi TaxID=2608987 RepID=A0A6A7YBF8_9HYPH|nr:SH3 domain-containing protein [Segnochrobactrum spirostomi]MQT14992.1 SH3 domain-containing protein [Segnochrobactrum spirostomi]